MEITRYKKGQPCARPRSILIYGDTGVGKSHIIASLGSAGMPVLFIDFDHRLGHLTNSFDIDSVELEFVLVKV